jgi:hypothetical protein
MLPVAGAYGGITYPVPVVVLTWGGVPQQAGVLHSACKRLWIEAAYAVHWELVNILSRHGHG